MNLYVVFAVLIFIVCVLMILVVLVQNSKGGGLASNFASSNQYMGVRKTADFLEKATWTLAIALLVFTLVSTISIPHYNGTQKATKTELQNQAANKAVNYTPAPQQNQGGQGNPGGQGNQGGQNPTPPAQ
jgi:preprotein translocase subunit SecG